MSPIISIAGLSKTYTSNFEALKSVDLDVQPGEIFALLGPNGAGKTTLINILCGIVRRSSGTVLVDGRDIDRDFRHVRSIIGLVPQELHTDSFETVWATVAFSRGLFGKRADSLLIEKILRDLSLWDKRNSKIMTLSGGMKRRVMIAKALSHEPRILFLDEPTAGVDVELRKGMWQVVRELQRAGVTVILTTHYIEEAEEMADRVGVISNGELLLVEEKASLITRLGRKQLVLYLAEKLDAVPPSFAQYDLSLVEDGRVLEFNFDTRGQRTGITGLLADLAAANIRFTDLETRQSTLEDIFVNLVGRAK